jgi:hypothetical protein
MRIERARHALLTLLLASGLAFAVPVHARAATLQVGPGMIYTTPSAAAARVHDGDHVEIAPGTYYDCAVWRASDLVIEGTGPGVVITDKTCKGKGLFVVDGNNITVRNLTLARARVPDMNGAGIREEGQNLTVDGVKFINNQNGILGNPSPHSTIVIRNSDFERNGVCHGQCAHGIYFGPLTLLRVEHSRFFETLDGHSIKSRAARTEVIDCDIADGANGTSSYLIDVPDGGAVVIKGNRLEKGPNAGNHTAIAIGEEDVTQPTPMILIEDNIFRNDGHFTATFVWNVTATPAILKGNTLSNSVTPLRGDGKVE